MSAGSRANGVHIVYGWGSRGTREPLIRAVAAPSAVFEWLVRIFRIINVNKEFFIPTVICSMHYFNEHSELLLSELDPHKT